jgi:hypothetical protein
MVANRLSMIQSGCQRRFVPGCHGMAWFLAAAVIGASLAPHAVAEPPADSAYEDIIDPVKLADMARSVLSVATFEEPEWSWASRSDGLSGKGFDLQKTSKPLTFSCPDVINGSAGAVSWWVRFRSEIEDAAVRLLQINDGGGMYVMYQGAKAWDIRHRHALGHYFFPPKAKFIQYTKPICPTPDNPDPGWVNITWTWEANSSRVYIDGNLAVERRHDVSVAENAKAFVTLQIGAPGQDAVVDEVRFYNRLLSQADVKGFVAAVRSDALRSQALALPQRLADKVSGSCQAFYRLSDHTVVIAADLASRVSAGEQISVVIEDQDHRQVSQTRVTVTDPTTLLNIALPVPADLRDGTYTVALNPIDGRPGLQATFSRQRYPWEGNTIGILADVPKPWVPVAVQGTESSKSDLVLSVWGRDYTLNQLGLPKAIQAWQPEPTRGQETANLLAKPVSVIAVQDNRELAWENTERKIVSRSPREIVIQASAESTQLRMELRGTLEFDGLYDLRVLLTPKEASVQLDELRIDIPVPDDQAVLWNASSDSMRAQKAFLDISKASDGLLWDSIRGITATGEAVLTVADRAIPVWPHTWVGNDDRGIAMMVENTHTWPIDEKQPVMTLARGEGATTWRLIPVNVRRSVEQPIEIHFSLQATPVRSRPAGGSGKQLEWYGWGYFDLPVIAADLEPGGTKKQGRPWYRTPQAKEEDRWWRYGCLQSHRVPLDDAVFGDMIKATRGEWANGLYTPSHIDFLLWSYQQWHEKEGMDGMYFDNTYPQRADDFGSGLAYVGGSGRVMPSYNVFGQREFLKRVQGYFQSVGPLPVMMTHVTDCPAVGYLGFGDFWLDGENGGYLAHAKQVDHDEGRSRYDFIDRWYNPTGMANLRVTLGRQWGPLPRYLYTWFPEPTYAMLGMFDLEHNYEPMGRKPYHEFGRFAEDVKFLPYWTANRPLKLLAAGPDVFLTAWSRPDRFRILVSNLSDEARKVSCAVDLARLGLPSTAVAVDEREGSELPLVNGQLTDIEVPAHSYRTILVAKPGLYAPLPSHIEPGFLPAPESLIGQLCDDFSTWKPEWKKHVSKDSWRATGDSRKAVKRDIVTDPISCERGYLKVRNGSGLANNIRRSFIEDGCSVILKVREPNGLYEPGFGPGIRLLWSDGQEVGMTAWEWGPDHQKDRFRAFGPGVEKWGDLPATRNWMRIDLAAEDVALKTSTDGKTWRDVVSVPRANLSGPPAELVIGHGNMQDGLLQQFFYSSFFDEVIVSRPIQATAPAR